MVRIQASDADDISDSEREASRNPVLVARQGEARAREDLPATDH